MTAPTRAEARAHTGAGQTEREARDRIAPQAGTLRGRVLTAITERGDDGLTALEATLRLGYSRDRLYSVAPRLSELENDGYVEITGTRRPTPAEPRRQVYVATEMGRAWVEGQR